MLGTILTGGPLLLFGVAVWWQNSQWREAASSGSARLARAGLERSVAENLRAATVVLAEGGGLRQELGPVVRWEAKNQFTKAVSTVGLSKAYSGPVAFGRLLG
jgi:hypothetical protein